MQNNNIIIIAEHADGKISPAVFELAACAQILREYTGLPVKIIVAEDKLDAAAKQLANETGLDVTVVSTPEYSASRTQIFKNIPFEDLMGFHPQYICMTNNSFGLEIASALAVRINAACITGVEKISFSKDHLIFGRKIFNDKITASITSTAPITLLTIQPGSFKPVKKISSQKWRTFFINIPSIRHDIKHLGFRSDKGDTSKLTDAEVIVSAGNGIGKVENLDLIYRLADLFPKSSVAGSRPVCDKKWLDYNCQVGATGATVKPKLYIACGISGAGQHVAGMKESEMVVAINIDSRAAIFQNSDIGIIDNLETFIPLLIDTYQSLNA